MPVKPDFRWFSLAVVLVIQPVASDDLLAGTAWPTTRFKVEFSIPGDSRGHARDPGQVINDPDRKHAPGFVRSEADEMANQDWDGREKTRKDHNFSYDVLALFFESSLNEIAEALQQYGFEPPSLPLFHFNGETYYKVTVYDLPERKAKKREFGIYSDGKMYCNDPGVSRSAFIGIDSRKFMPLTSSDEALLYLVLAHELFHAIQESYTATFNALNSCMSETKDYKNVTEGFANGVAFKVLMKRWPKYYLEFRSETRYEALDGTNKNKAEDSITVWKFDSGTGHISPNLVGWRTYQVPFLDLSAAISDEGSQAPYLTASFWFNLIDRYDVRIIDHLLRQPLRYGDSPSILRWLNDGLGSYEEDIGGLYIAFPHFVTEFASQAGSRFPWDEFGAFGKDDSIGRTVYDRKGKSRATYRSTGTRQQIQNGWVNKILGECNEMKLVAGQSESDELLIEMNRVSAGCIDLSWQGFEQNFELHFELESSDLGLLEQVHFGLVYEENETQEQFCYNWVRPDYSQPLKTCLHEKPFVKNGPQQLNYIKDWREDGIRFTGTGRRLIAFSNVAEIAEKTRSIKKKDGVKLRVGIIRAHGEDGRQYDPPSMGPTGAGSVTAGPETLYGITRYPTSASSRLSFYIPVKDSDLAYGVQWTGEAPSLGYTGPYRGTVSKSSSGKRAIGSSFCRRHADGVVGQVTRFDRDHLWVDIEADLCEMTIPPPANGHFPKVDELKVSLQMPYGWRYSAENAPVDIVTPGMQVYIDRHSKRLPMVLSGEWKNRGSTVTGQPTSHSPSRSGTGQAPAAGSGETPSTVTDCNCSCEEYKELAEAGEAVGRGEGDEITNKLAGRMMNCVSQCQTEYMICQLDMDESEAAARANERQQTSVSECDCSCAGLRSLESRLASLGNKLQSGDLAAMGEMQKLGDCMSVCQGGFSDCMLGR